MKAKDSAIGSSFDQHVVGGYRFLMRFYCPGDDIYIFGFSRGAYIARFLAEMLDYVGLLSHGNEEMVQFAWKAFSQWQCRRSATGDDELKKKREMYSFLKGFRETFSRPVRRIRFLGLFDTVNSVPRFETAWMERSKFPYTARSSAKAIRHAVSIDERRAKFRQDLMYQSDGCAKPKAMDEAKGLFHDMQEKYRRHSHVSASQDQDTTDQHQFRGRKVDKLYVPGEPSDEPVRYRAHSRSKSRATHMTKTTNDNASICSREPPRSDMEDSDSEDETEQDIDEVWFAGGHGDVGGGWEMEPNSKSASHVPLVWMVREAMRAGLNFDFEKVIAMGCSEALQNSTTTSPGKKSESRPRIPLPNIHIEGVSPLNSPTLNSPDIGNKKNAECNGSVVSSFHEMICKAHLARTHDSLSFDCGMSIASVLSWKIMEYMPFRRMDLRPDGSWKPIRWPLPCGEVRDVPQNARVHGSVIRRMKLDDSYRPGNLIVGGGGRGCRKAPEEYGMGNWVCIADEGDPVGEIWIKRT